MTHPHTTRTAPRPSPLAVLLLAVATVGASPDVDADGLGIDVTHAVECGRRTRSGDDVSVHYNGTLRDGTPFDSSHNRHDPISFTLGRGQVISGWDRGLLDMCIGEERLLTIPPALAYGSRQVGVIPADSTLIFETQLVAIGGVEPETEPLYGDEGVGQYEHGTEDVGEDMFHDDEEGKDKPWHDYKEHDYSEHDYEDGHDVDGAADGYSIQTAPSIDPARPTGADDLEAAAATQQPIPPPPPSDPDNDGEPGRGGDTGECRLLGPFALFVQAGLGLLAILSLVWKRFRERPRRLFKVWFFDASKQVFGSALLHVFNLVMSMFATADFELAHHTQKLSTQMQTAGNTQVNPCSWYLINIAIDTTIGIPILVMWLRVLHHAFALTPLARPLESIRSGHYGQPPRATWWLKQSLIYFVALTLMKLCIYFIILLLPWIAHVGEWALRWTEGSEALQLAFVMFVFPLIMNALQYYIIDSFIKESAPGAAAGAAADARDARDEDDDAEGVAGSQPSYHSVDARDSLDSDALDRRRAVKADEERLLSGGSSGRSQGVDDDDDGGFKNEDELLRKDR